MCHMPWGSRTLRMLSRPSRIISRRPSEFIQFFSFLKTSLNYLISEYCYMIPDCSTMWRLHDVSLITSSYVLNFLIEQGDFVGSFFIMKENVSL